MLPGCQVAKLELFLLLLVNTHNGHCKQVWIGIE